MHAYKNRIYRDCMRRDSVHAQKKEHKRLIFPTAKIMYLPPPSLFLHRVHYTHIHSPAHSGSHACSQTRCFEKKRKAQWDYHSRDLIKSYVTLCCHEALHTVKIPCLSDKANRKWSRQQSLYLATHACTVYFTSDRDPDTCSSTQRKGSPVVAL